MLIYQVTITIGFVKQGYRVQQLGSASENAILFLHREIDLLQYLKTDLLWVEGICFCWSCQFALFQLMCKIIVFYSRIPGEKLHYPWCSTENSTNQRVAESKLCQTRYLAPPTPMKQCEWFNHYSLKTLMHISMHAHFEINLKRYCFYIYNKQLWMDCFIFLHCF